MRPSSAYLNFYSSPRIKRERDLSNKSHISLVQKLTLTILSTKRLFDKRNIDYRKNKELSLVSNLVDKALNDFDYHARRGSCLLHHFQRSLAPFSFVTVTWDDLIFLLDLGYGFFVNSSPRCQLSP